MGDIARILGRGKSTHSSRIDGRCTNPIKPALGVAIAFCPPQYPSLPENMHPHANPGWHFSQPWPHAEELFWQ
jgi:hypothetical protein